MMRVVVWIYVKLHGSHQDDKARGKRLIDQACMCSTDSANGDALANGHQQKACQVAQANSSKPTMENDKEQFWNRVKRAYGT